MYPILFEISGFQVHSYGFATIIACCLCAWRVVINRPEYMELNDIVNICLITLCSMFFTDKLLHIILNKCFFDFYDFVNLRKQYMHSFYGTLWVTLILICLYCIIKKKPVLTSLDFLLYHAIPALVIQRMFGCFFAGCCYGSPTDLPWGITFPFNSPAGMAYSKPIHPTQLYYGIFALLLYWGLYCYQKNTPTYNKGNVFAFGLMGLSLSYLLISIYRGDNAANFIPLHTIVLSVGTFIFGFLIYTRNKWYCMMKKHLFIFITIFFSCFCPKIAYANELSINFTPDSYLKWGESMTCDIVAMNPKQLTCDGNITVSFNKKVLVIEKDRQVKTFSSGTTFYNKNNQSTQLKNLMIKKNYTNWMPKEKKTLYFKIIPIQTGLLKIFIRATFYFSSEKIALAFINIPQDQTTIDQLGYPVKTCRVSVDESRDLFGNILMLSKYEDFFFSAEFHQNFQKLLDHSGNRYILNLFGFNDLKDALKQITILKKIIGNSAEIKQSPVLLSNIKKIILDPTDIDAQEFFGIVEPRKKIVHKNDDPQLNSQKGAEGYILLFQGGFTLMKKIRSAKDINFIPSDAENIISIRFKEKNYSFERRDTIVHDIALKLDQLKPDGNFSEVVDILKNNMKKAEHNKTYISYLGFFDIKTSEILPQSLNERVEAQISKSIKKVIHNYQHLSFNESEHRIINSPGNIKRFMSIILNKQLTETEKREQINKQLMIPNNVDAIISGMYTEDSHQIKVSIFFIDSKNNRLIRQHRFLKNQLLCRTHQHDSHLEFCPEATKILSQLIVDIFSSL